MFIKNIDVSYIGATTDKPVTQPETLLKLALMAIDRFKCEIKVDEMQDNLRWLIMVDEDYVTKIILYHGRKLLYDTVCQLSYKDTLYISDIRTRL